LSSKLVSLEDLGSIVHDGQSVALGGAWLCNHPMAAVRQLVRAGRRDLHIYSLIGSVDVDLLLAAGAVSHLTFSMVTLEAFGLAPNLRRQVEGGDLQITELTGLSMEVALEAAGRNVPFLPYPALGQPETSDLVRANPAIYDRVLDPFAGGEVLVVRALQPEVTIVHALRADRDGNAQFDGTHGIDDVLAKVPGTVVVTCEEVVSREVIVESAHMTKVPGYLVDHVIEAPFGAHPTSHVPRYSLDAPEMLDYALAAGAGDEEQQAYVERIRRETEAEYRERVLAQGRDLVLAELVRQGRILEAATS
jgi:glutaconate CoA-transferase subunit A